MRERFLKLSCNFMSGYSILSAAALFNVTGECDPATRPQMGDNTTNLGITFKAGTSMACPGAAGAAAILRQYFMEGWFPTGTKNATNEMTPSGTLIKAALLNGAQPLVGVNNFFFISPVASYDNNIGFGLLNLEESLPMQGENMFRGFVTDKKSISDSENQDYTFSISIAADECTRETVSTTLVWADPPGTTGCTHCLVNDLDLEVTVNDGPSIYPNGLSSKDDTNNAERVQIAVSDGDNIRVTVRAANLATSSQTYSLIVTGCIEETHITHIPSLSPSSSLSPSNLPSKLSSSLPTVAPSLFSSSAPSQTPSSSPLSIPSSLPTNIPSSLPTAISSSSPTSLSSSVPTSFPTLIPTSLPTSTPSSLPTVLPTSKLTSDPSSLPTFSPSSLSTSTPSSSPSSIFIHPSGSPSEADPLNNENVVKDYWTIGHPSVVEFIDFDHTTVMKVAHTLGEDVRNVRVTLYNSGCNQKLDGNALVKIGKQSIDLKN